MNIFKRINDSKKVITFYPMNSQDDFDGFFADDGQSLAYKFVDIQYNANIAFRGVGRFLCRNKSGSIVEPAIADFVYQHYTEINGKYIPVDNLVDVRIDSDQDRSVTYIIGSAQDKEGLYNTQTSVGTGLGLSYTASNLLGFKDSVYIPIDSWRRAYFAGDNVFGKSVLLIGYKFSVELQSFVVTGSDSSGVTVQENFRQTPYPF